MSVNSALRVPYNIPGSSYWQWVNIYTRLSQERILFLNQPLTTDVANSLITALLYLDSEEQNKPIYIYINSLGDPVLAGMTNETLGMMAITAGLAVYDSMQHVKSEIVTICLGQAVSMAALILSSGSKGKRISLPHASIALTQFRSLAQGQATDLQINAKQVLDKKNLILEILAQNTGQSVEKIAKDSERILYMTPEEAKEYGLIDKVLTTSKALPTPVPA